MRYRWIGLGIVPVPLEKDLRIVVRREGGGMAVHASRLWQCELIATLHCHNRPDGSAQFHQSYARMRSFVMCTCIFCVQWTRPALTWGGW